MEEYLRRITLAQYQVYFNQDTDKPCFSFGIGGVLKNNSISIRLKLDWWELLHIQIKNQTGLVENMCRRSNKNGSQCQTVK